MTNINVPQVPSAEPQAAEALMTHAKSQSQKIDAKSILLMDRAGKVQEPTTETLSLLGTRTQAAFRKMQQKDALSDSLSSSDPQHAKKRLRMENGDHMDLQVRTEVLRCSYESCKKEFRSLQFLKTHLAYHESRANFVCTVPSCKKSFNYRHNLSIHMRVHNDHRPFECPQNCGKSFRTKGNMMDHLRRHYAIK